MAIKVGINGFGRIGRNAFVGGVTGVPDDVIPYGLVWGNRARLQGLNLIGLKRRGPAIDPHAAARGLLSAAKNAA